MRSGTDHPNFGIGRARRDQFAIFSDEAQNARIQQVCRSAALPWRKRCIAGIRGTPSFVSVRCLHGRRHCRGTAVEHSGRRGKGEHFHHTKGFALLRAGIRGFRDAMQRYPLDLWSFTKIMTTGKSPITRRMPCCATIPMCGGFLLARPIPKRCASALPKAAPGGNFPHHQRFVSGTGALY